ncbi:MAG: hypothetical protein JNJ54_03915 [Myxococcaceae bacterium]|nr:hypothetical protein [Myxococcaceae bacterium]
MLCAGLHAAVAYIAIVIYALHYRRLHQALRFGLTARYSRLDGRARAGQPAEPVFVRRMYVFTLVCAVGLPLAVALAWPAKRLFEVAAFALSDCAALPRDAELSAMTGLEAVTRFTFTNVGKGRCGRHVELWGRETVDDLWFTIEAPLTDQAVVESVRITEDSSRLLPGEPVLHRKFGVVGVCGALLRADLTGTGTSSDALSRVLTTSQEQLRPRCPLAVGRR